MKILLKVTENNTKIKLMITRVFWKILLIQILSLQTTINL